LSVPLPALTQAREFFRFELRQQLRQPAFWISVLICVAAGIGLAATDVGALSVAAGRIPRNVPYAMLNNLVGLSAMGMFVMLVSVGQAAMRDFSSGTAPLIFSRPVVTRGYLLGRFAGGYVVGLLAVLCGALASVLTMLALRGSDPEIGPISWLTWVYGIVCMLAPNLLLAGALVFLLALWTRSMGASFLGLLPLMFGQDIAEALPVAIFGYQLPALLDPLGIAGLVSVTRTWTVQQYTHQIPGLSGDLLLNRLIWGSITALGLLLSQWVFARRTRRADLGERSRKPAQVESAEDGTSSSVASSLPQAKPQQGLALQLQQMRAIMRFELRRMLSTLTFKVLFLSALAFALYGVTRGERVMGVLSVPEGRNVAFALRGSGKLVMTLLITLFAGDLVWREQSTRMGLILDSLGSPLWTRVAGKLGALSVLVFGTMAALGACAWALQSSLAEGVGRPAEFSQVAMMVAHESLSYLQLAAVAVLLQTIAGGRMAGYMAMAGFLVLRLGLVGMGYRSDLYSIASLRMPQLTGMDGFGHSWPRVLLVHGYWTLMAFSMACAAGLLWPRGVLLSFGERVAQARQRAASGGGIALAFSLALSLLAGLNVYAQIEAPGMGWNRDQLDAIAVRYEEEFQHWIDVPKPEVITLMGDMEVVGRQVHVRGRYVLSNQHPESIERMLVDFGPDLELHGLRLHEGSSATEFEQLVSTRKASGLALTDNVEGVPGSVLGTQVMHFDPPLASGATISLDFDLEFAPKGLGPRPADRWIKNNGSLLMCGTGTYEFFQGSRVFPSFGYNADRELRSTRSRKRHGLEAWEGPVDPHAYEQDRSARDVQGEAAACSDWAHAELWIHTPSEQHAIAPGKFLARTLQGDRATHHYRTKERIQAFFPVVIGEYEHIGTRMGEVDIDLFYHAAHPQRVQHILWALERSLAYFEEHWGPYPHEFLRMGEIPGANSYACSFPGMMAFAEGMSFTCPAGDGHALDFPGLTDADAETTDLDPILWIVAHEVAHQWWDADVLPAKALGAGFASESLAQYGSLAVVHAEYGEAVAQRVVQFEWERYMTGRSSSDRQERTLTKVDDQAHLHYGKGMVAFHALAQLAGYEAVDKVLAEIVTKHGGKDGPPLTSLQLIAALEAGLPPELGPILQELLSEIAFVESAVTRAELRETDNTDTPYRLHVEADVKAMRADGDGAETPYDYEGPLEFNVLFQDGEPAVRLEAQVTDGRVSFDASFPAPPTSVRTDPRLLHLDRDLTNNSRSVVELAQ
jgi:ABC-2 type transport system permease protein